MSQAPIVIFVRPQAQGNIGALARVMSNFGLTELRLVGTIQGTDAFSPRENPIDWALACKGQEIFENAKHYKNLEDAVADLHWAVGTSARAREKTSGYSRPVVSFETFLEKTHPAIGARKWAIVLGPEDDGLSEKDCSLCQTLIHIPTVDANPSMNVAMAAGCLFYHWHRSIAATDTADSTHEPSVPLGDLEKLSEYIFRMLKETEFFKYPDADAVHARLRRIFQTSQISRGDVLFLFEIFYQLKSKILGRFEERNFLSNT